MDDNSTDTRTPDEIERDIRATQADMSRTADQLGQELTPRNLFNSLLDKAEESGVDAHYLLDAARRNPLALGMIAIGGLWLVSDADARPSALKPSGMRRSGSGRSDGDVGSDGWHGEHRAYVEHMARCERRPDEDDLAYRRRRDAFRADYFLIEQRHDEDETSHRKRLDEATEKLRQSREQAAERVRNAASRTRDGARDALSRTREGARGAASRAQGAYFENPLLSGLAAAFVGAIAGSALPATRTEEEYLGSFGERAIDTARDKARQAGEQARQKKDEMVDQVEDHMGEGGSGGTGGQERQENSPGHAQRNGSYQAL